MELRKKGEVNMAEIYRMIAKDLGYKINKSGTNTFIRESISDYLEQ